MDLIVGKEIDCQGAADDAKVLDGMKSLSKERFTQMLQSVCDKDEREIAHVIDADGAADDAAVVEGMKMMSEDKMRAMLERDSAAEAGNENNGHSRIVSFIHRFAIAATLVVSCGFVGALLVHYMGGDKEYILAEHERNTEKQIVVQMPATADASISDEAMDALYEEYKSKIPATASLGASDMDEYYEGLRSAQENDSVENAELEYLRSRIDEGEDRPWYANATFRSALNHLHKHDLRAALVDLDKCKSKGGEVADMADELANKLRTPQQ